MKLYLHPLSPNCVKVLVTAALSDIALETEVVDFAAQQHRTPAYLARNPNGLFPLLVDGDFALWESNAIAQYLASRKPSNALWPHDDRARADIARWQFWELAHWFPAVRPFQWENLFKPMKGQGEPDPAVLDKATAALHPLAAMLDDHLATRTWLAGPDMTLADLSVASTLVYRRPARMPLEPYAHLNRWMERIEALPAWRAAQPPALG
jgi:glutathione S-transferase